MRQGACRWVSLMKLRSINLVAGETLLLYTDGISEARAPDGRMFGAEGIEDSLQGFGGDAKGVIERLRESLIAYQDGRRPDDDQTAIAIHVGKL